MMKSILYRRLTTLILMTASILAIDSLLIAQSEWKPADNPLMTQWAADVDPGAPLPEYPRPQFVRKNWQNLNGLWDYAVTDENAAKPVTWTGKILVPYAFESALSGVAGRLEQNQDLWYQRSFKIPASWNQQRVILHFGAVDYKTTVYVNNQPVGSHEGGYDPFSFDITDQLKTSGAQTLTVQVNDKTNYDGKPRGKQTLWPQGIMYTPTSGIWQTVWLEPVANVSVEDFKLIPDIDNDSLKVNIEARGNASGAKVSLKARNGRQTVGTAEGKMGKDITLNIKNPVLWTPDNPHLYDLDIEISQAGKVTDKVQSYFAMRKIELGTDNGRPALLLNGKNVFQFGPLDQGFWPDGIYTAPTDEALKNDIEMMKKFGFNMVRKHIKVEPARWYYYTDKLGLMVWQDMPSANSYRRQDHPQPPVDEAAYERELRAMVDNLYNHPSIIMWVIFNESQGQHKTEHLVSVVRSLDPSRLINEASGGGHRGTGDVRDMHSYPPPNCPKPFENQALVCGEYGGIGLRVPGHMWQQQGNWGYTEINTGTDLENLYASFANMVKKFKDERGMCAAVYTQITDVEIETNGLLTYDRKLKTDSPEWIAGANRFEWEGPTYTPIVDTSEKESKTWQYTTIRPQDNWFTRDFDDSSWTAGEGGFGTRETPNIGRLGTTWSTSDIWLRRTFTLPNLSKKELAQLKIRDYHDEDVEIYINGVLAYQAERWVTGYEVKDLTDEARAALIPGGQNVFAVHCRQTGGGQYVDVGLGIDNPNR